MVGMQEWTREVVWAEHDAAHERALRLKAFLWLVVLMSVWNGLALFAYVGGERARLRYECAARAPDEASVQTLPVHVTRTIDNPRRQSWPALTHLMPISR